MERLETTVQLLVDGEHVQRTFLGTYGTLLQSRTECRTLRHSADTVWTPEQLFAALFGDEAGCTNVLNALLSRRRRLTPVSSGGARKSSVDSNV